MIGLEIWNPIVELIRFFGFPIYHYEHSILQQKTLFSYETIKLYFKMITNNRHQSLSSRQDSLFSHKLFILYTHISPFNHFFRQKLHIIVFLSASNVERLTFLFRLFLLVFGEREVLSASLLYSIDDWYSFTPNRCIEKRQKTLKSKDLCAFDNSTITINFLNPKISIWKWILNFY